MWVRKGLIMLFVYQKQKLSKYLPLALRRETRTNAGKPGSKLSHPIKELKDYPGPRRLFPSADILF